MCVYRNSLGESDDERRTNASQLVQLNSTGEYVTVLKKVLAHGRHTMFAYMLQSCNLNINRLTPEEANGRNRRNDGVAQRMFQYCEERANKGMCVCVCVCICVCAI